MTSRKTGQSARQITSIKGDAAPKRLFERKIVPKSVQNADADSIYNNIDTVSVSGLVYTPESISAKVTKNPEISKAAILVPKKRPVPLILGKISISFSSSFSGIS